jgi:hypothetical protein
VFQFAECVGATKGWGSFARGLPKEMCALFGLAVGNEVLDIVEVINEKSSPPDWLVQFGRHSQKAERRRQAKKRKSQQSDQ